MSYVFSTCSDAYLAVTNLAQDQKDDHVKRIAEFSIAAMNAAHEVLIDEDDPTKGGVQIRVGFHTGKLVGLIGRVTVIHSGSFSHVHSAFHSRPCCFRRTWHTSA